MHGLSAMLSGVPGQGLPPNQDYWLSRIRSWKAHSPQPRLSPGGQCRCAFPCSSCPRIRSKAPGRAVSVHGMYCRQLSDDTAFGKADPERAYPSDGDMQPAMQNCNLSDERTPDLGINMQKILEKGWNQSKAWQTIAQRAKPTSGATKLVQILPSPSNAFVECH